MNHTFFIPAAYAAGNENNSSETHAVSAETHEAEAHNEGLTLDPAVMAFQALNFLILLIILHKVLYKPLIKLLTEREKKIREGVENADKAELLLKESSSRRDEMLKQAKVEGQHILDKASKSAEETRLSLLSEAQKEADKIVENGHKLVGMEKAKAAQDIQKHMVNLLITATEKVLKEKVDAEKDAKLISESIKSYSL